MQGHADHSVAARGRERGAELADARRSGRRAYRQVAVEGWGVRHRRGRTDSARRRASGLLSAGTRGIVQNVSPGGKKITYQSRSASSLTSLRRVSSLAAARSASLAVLKICPSSTL